MKKIKAKKNQKVKITKDGKVVFDKKLTKNMLIETNAEVVVS